MGHVGRNIKHMYVFVVPQKLLEFFGPVSAGTVNDPCDLRVGVDHLQPLQMWKNDVQHEFLECVAGLPVLLALADMEP